jgi:hypothetical protein
LILKVLKPLYGVPEAENHWFKTYYAHHVKNLNMTQSTYDLCLLYSNKPFGIVGLQTDDTLFLADKTFADTEENEFYKAKFMAKGAGKTYCRSTSEVQRSHYSTWYGRDYSYTRTTMCKP